MKVLIVDNEQPMREAIEQLLVLFCPTVTNIETASDIESGLACIRQFQPDLLLLDVELDNGDTGFDLLRRWNAPPTFELVFVTAHDKYAIDAFRFSAIDYLLKPVDPEALMQCVQKVDEHRRNQHLAGQIDFLLTRMAAPKTEPKRLALKDADHIYYVRPADILFCEADGVYTRFVVEGLKMITVSKNLKEYEALLEPLGFLRTHNSFLVNPEKVTRYDKANETLLLEGGHNVPLAQRKKEAILKLLNRE
jgi:two-component system, LytTR family, response regulator